MKFIFDLDTSIISNEIWHIIERHYDCQELSELTKRTISGEVPYIESHIRKVNRLSNFSVSEINSLLSEVSIHPEIKWFIDAHQSDCIVVTGNLYHWCKGLFNIIGCQCFGSEAICKNDRIIKLSSIIRKEDIVDRYLASGETVCFVGGGGNGNYEAMRHSNISVATGFYKNFVHSLFPICDYVVYNEHALCRQLKQLCGINKDEKSVVISCAGIGSRLGLGLSKALVPINGRSLISCQLELFRNVEDVRIVIGFQCNEIIDEVRKYRENVIFCFNHRYLETKTGASFYLGARHANEYVLEWDGDLLVHPDEVKQILSKKGEFICYSEKSSDEAVWVQTDEDGNVLAFSRENGNYEWTGPACVAKRNLKDTTQNVFNMLEPLLPLHGMRIRAYDIDTYDDYQRVQEKTIAWYI